MLGTGRMKLLVTFIVVCTLMVGVLAWYFISMPSPAKVAGTTERDGVADRGGPEPNATSIRQSEAASSETPGDAGATEAALPSESTPDHGLDSASIAPPAAPSPAAGVAPPSEPGAAPAPDDVPPGQPSVAWPSDPALREAWRRFERAQAALREDPYHARALRDKAAAAAELRLWSELAAALARLVELAPNDSALRFERAAALIHLRQWVDAIAELNVVVAQQPQHAKGWFDLAVAHQALGHLSDARRAWDRAIELEPSAEALARRGEVLLDLQQWTEAAADFEAVLQEQPGAADATLNLALALAKLGRPEEARRRLLTLLEDQPRHVPALNRLAELAYAACRDDGVSADVSCAEAAEWCRRSLAITPNQPEVQALLEEAAAVHGP